MYKESAEKGYIEGMFNLGQLCYRMAKETKSQEQFKIAAHWFLELTMRDPDNAEPWFYLGQLYQSGYGTAGDPHCGADQKTAF